MSIIKSRFSYAAIIIVEVLLSAVVFAAQDIEATFKVSLPATVEIRGKLTKENLNRAEKNWSFRQSVAGIENLGARVSEFGLFDAQNRPIAIKKLADGEYLAGEKAENFSYRVNLDSAPDIAAMAHASWLAGEQGVLMPDDLLPQIVTDNRATSARIKFDLPADWKIITSETHIGENAFSVENLEKAVFSIGKSWRAERVSNDETALNLAISGEWRFSDSEAAKMAGEIYAEYQKLFGEPSAGKTQIFLIRAAKETKFGRWAAETRGVNTTIVSGDTAFKTQSMQLLHEQLRHEIFHLWIPNKLALTGNYDWFYEGFTVYQALRTGVSMNQIGFEDFLETLAQAYRTDSFPGERKSLIESSKNRWRAAGSRVYARGMLAAFACDVALLRTSRGKRSISEIFREVYRKHSIPRKPEAGNEAILKILRVYAELDPVIEKYINGAEPVNWNTDLETIGIEATEENSFVRLRVKAKPSGRQKDLLNELGYNNWRKMSGKRK